jgi:hypothetical protein
MVDSERGDQKTLAFHRATVYHPCGITGNQDEHFGRIGEHQRLERKLRHDVVRDMVDEYAEKGEAAKKAAGRA